MKNSLRISIIRKNTRKRYADGFPLLALIVFFCLILSSETFSQTYAGGYAESYLQRNVGARQIGMAGAYSAIANDPMTVFYNPAGLAFFSDETMISSSHSILQFGRTHSAIAWGQSFEQVKDFGFGFGINNFTSGAFQGRDVMGRPTGELRDWQLAFVGSAAYKMEYASVGMSVKYLSNSLAGSDIAAQGYAVDLGTKFNVMNLFSAGIVVQNLSGMMFWNTESDEYELLPYTVRAGIAMEYGLNEETFVRRSPITGEPEEVYLPATRYILVGVDAVLNQFENGPTIVLGVEAVPDEIIAFRGGIALAGDDRYEYKAFPMNVWGGGASFRPDIRDKYDLPFDLQIDYSVANDELADNNIAHHLTLVVFF